MFGIGFLPPNQPLTRDAHRFLSYACAENLAWLWIWNSPWSLSSQLCGTGDCILNHIHVDSHNPTGFSVVIFYFELFGTSDKLHSKVFSTCSTRKRGRDWDGKWKSNGFVARNTNHFIALSNGQEFCNVFYWIRRYLPSVWIRLNEALRKGKEIQIGLCWEIRKWAGRTEWVCSPDLMFVNGHKFAIMLHFNPKMLNQGLHLDHHSLQYDLFKKTCSQSVFKFSLNSRYKCINKFVQYSTELPFQSVSQLCYSFRNSYRKGLTGWQIHTALQSQLTERSWSGYRIPVLPETLVISFCRERLHQIFDACRPNALGLNQKTFGLSTFSLRPDRGESLVRCRTHEARGQPRSDWLFCLHTYANSCWKGAPVINSDLLQDSETEFYQDKCITVNTVLMLLKQFFSTVSGECLGIL